LGLREGVLGCTRGRGVLGCTRGRGGGAQGQPRSRRAGQVRGAYDSGGETRRGCHGADARSVEHGEGQGAANS
jgi:hypothetical protein